MISIASHFVDPENSSSPQALEDTMNKADEK
jgi:hypothetical protein